MSAEPLSIARRLGSSIGVVGAGAMEELELAYASRLLPKFKDNPKVRTAQHVLLYWTRGFYRSTLLEIFSETIPEDLGIVDITSMSRESIFGSVDKHGNPIRPAFADKAFVLITELLSFLGSGWTMRDLASTMNVAMEGQRVTRHLLKLAQPEYDHVSLSDLRAIGVRWDPSEGVMTYVPNISVLAASTLLLNRVFTYLTQSGFLDRFHVIPYKFSDKELSNNLHRHRLLDQEAKNELKLINEKLRNVKVSEMEMPTEELMKPIYDTIEAMVDDEVRQNPRLKKEQIQNPRMRGDLLRELAGHCFLRTAHNNGFNDIDELEYTTEDEEFIHARASHFLEPRLAPSVADEWISPRIRKKRPKDQVKEYALGLLMDERLWSRQKIVRRIRAMMHVSTATIDNALRDLVDEGKVDQPEYGFYKLSGGY